MFVCVCWCMRCLDLSHLGAKAVIWASGWPRVWESDVLNVAYWCIGNNQLKVAPFFFFFYNYLCFSVPAEQSQRGKVERWPKCRPLGPLCSSGNACKMHRCLCSIVFFSFGCPFCFTLQPRLLVQLQPLKQLQAEKVQALKTLTGLFTHGDECHPSLPLHYGWEP